MNKLDRGWGHSIVPTLPCTQQHQQQLVSQFQLSFPGVAEHLRNILEDLFESYEVDMVMSGHVHAYARTCNMYKEKCLKNKKGGMTHMTLGKAAPVRSLWLVGSFDWSIKLVLGLTNLPYWSAI